MSVIPFEFQSHAVRTVVSESTGEVLFVGKDVAVVLGYKNHNKAMQDHCKGVQIRYPLQTAGGKQELRVLTEADVLRLIICSHMPAAVEFERWVFEEVLPSIRKTGSYSVAKVEPVRLPTPIDTEQQMLALKRVLGDAELKAMSPIVWQQLSDAVQNQALAFLGVAQKTDVEPVYPLDVMELARRAGISVPSNLASSLGRFVKKRCQAVEVARVVNGAVRICHAYLDHNSATEAIRDYMFTRETGDNE